MCPGSVGAWETDKGVPRFHEQRASPEAGECSHSHTYTMHKHTCTYCSHTHTQHQQGGTHNTNRVAHTHGMLNNREILILLDSGASCSVVSRLHAAHAHITSAHTTRLVNADGRDITPCGTATLTISLGKFSTTHTFVVVDHLSTPVILGCDFLVNHSYVLDFKNVRLSESKTQRRSCSYCPQRQLLNRSTP